MQRSRSSCDEPGFSGGVNLGDHLNQDALQYGGAQTSYNWSCCGLRLSTGACPGRGANENDDSFNFTLAGPRHRGYIIASIDLSIRLNSRCSPTSPASCDNESVRLPQRKATCSVLVPDLS